MKSHAAVAAVLLGSEELVRQCLDDIDSSGLTDAEKLLMHFLDKVNEASPAISPDDITPLLRGWVDGRADLLRHHGLRAVQFLQPMDRRDGRPRALDEAHREGGKRSAAGGYARK